MSTEATPAATPTPAPAAESAPAATAPTSPPAPPATPAPAASASAAPTGATPTDAAPADYALKMPEGFTADEAVLTEFKGVAKELGLKPEGAQQLADLYAKASKSAADRQIAAAETRQKEWQAAVKNDKDFGGQHFEASQMAARKVMARFDQSGEFAKFLNETGLGDHPALFRIFAAMGSAMSEDSLAGTTTNGTQTAANSEEAFLRAMYPTMHRSA